MKSAKQPKPQTDANLLENKKVIKKAYQELSSQNDESSLLMCSSEMMDKLMEILSYAQDETGKLLLSFQKEIELKTSENWPNFKVFFPIVTSWVSNNKILTIREVKAQENVLQHLEKSIKQYQVLCKVTKDPEELNLSKQVLELLLESKKRIKAAYKKVEIKFSGRTHTTPQEQKSIQEIFSFYSKQHIMVGKNPTFDMLGETVENMDSGSFLHFSKNFDICSNKKVDNKRYLTKDEIIKIFKHSATLQKSMNLQGFINSLDEIAELYFNEEYEKLVPFKCSSLDLDKKRIMLFEILKLDNPKYVNKACLPIRTPFGPSHDKVIKPTIGKKLVVPNEDEVKEQIYKYKTEKKSKNQAIQEEKGKEVNEKAKMADLKLKEKKEQEELKKRKDIFRMEDLAKAKYNDFDEENRLEDLING